MSATVQSLICSASVNGLNSTPLSGIAITLAVERLMRTDLFEQEHRKEAAAKKPAWRDMQTGRQLRDIFAIPSIKTLLHGLKYLPAANNKLNLYKYYKFHYI